MRLLGVVVTSLLATSACGVIDNDPTPTECGGGKCDSNDPIRCTIGNESGRAFSAADLSDPLARAVLRGTGACPTSLDSILGALRTDYQGHCNAGTQGEGLRAALVSERADILGRPANYRAVITRQCEVNSKADVFGLVFEFQANPDGSMPSQLPDGLEFIAADRANKRFNYYAVQNGSWKFFGDSRDMIKPGASEQILCAKCHTSGGLVMREKAMPWPHWSSEFGSFSLPGETALRAAFPVLPPGGGGQAMEDLVHGNNSLWARGRFELLRDAGSTKELLRPLFCDTDLNVSAGGYRGNFTNGSSFDTRCPPNEPRCTFDAFPTELVVPQALGGGPNVVFPVQGQNYFTAVAANNQRMVATYPNGPQLVHADGKPVFDDMFGVLYPVRSHADNMHVWTLSDEGIIDQDLLLDVMSIDFTRPTGSARRCKLVERVPDVPAPVTAAALRQAMISALDAIPSRTSDESALLAALRAPADTAAHEAAVTTFKSACMTRLSTDNLGFVRDMLGYLSVVRNRLRTIPAMRGEHNVPVDDLSLDPTTHFDPQTCKLVTD